ncbi:hypothetical protein ACFRCW_42180 [Streptomyces sp. NPDC056653]
MKRTLLPYTHNKTAGGVGHTTNVTITGHALVRRRLPDAAGNPLAL